jgi:hypothetical protein
VLGDFSFKIMVYEILPNFVYLFMYPFVDGNLCLCHARARPHPFLNACSRSFYSVHMSGSESLVTRDLYCEFTGSL